MHIVDQRLTLMYISSEKRLSIFFFDAIILFYKIITKKIKIKVNIIAKFQNEIAFLALVNHSLKEDR